MLVDSATQWLLLQLQCFCRELGLIMCLGLFWTRRQATAPCDTCLRPCFARLRMGFYIKWYIWFKISEISSKVQSANTKHLCNKTKFNAIKVLGCLVRLLLTWHRQRRRRLTTYPFIAFSFSMNMISTNMNHGNVSSEYMQKVCPIFLSASSWSWCLFVNCISD